MAIIDELGLEVKVVINGSEATECYRYVESIDDAHFAVSAGTTSKNAIGKNWIKRTRHHYLAVNLYIDGERRAASFVHQRRNSTVQFGVLDSAAQPMQKFWFTSVSTTDDTNKQRISNDLKTVKNLGLMQAAVYCAIDTGIQVKPKTSFPKTAEGGISLAEKALKGRAISYGITLSAPTKYSFNVRETNYVDKLASPLAVFFKYRSRESLQQEMIIPRPRSLSIEPDVDNLSPEELRRLAGERLLQMKGNNKRAASIKIEEEIPRPRRPYKFVKIEGGKKAIDLTEDG